MKPNLTESSAPHGAHQGLEEDPIETPTPERKEKAQRVNESMHLPQL